MAGGSGIMGKWYPAIQQARAAAYSMLDVLDSSHPFRSRTFYNATFLYGPDFASVGLTQIPRDGKGYQEIIPKPLPRTYREALIQDVVPVGILSPGDPKHARSLKRAIHQSVNLADLAS